MNGKTIQTQSEHRVSLRKLTEDEIDGLKQNGCHSSDWSKINVASDFDVNRISHVHFVGDVAISTGVSLKNIMGGIGNCTIGENTVIENVDRIFYEPESECGLGIEVNVLDESGSRAVRIFPGLSAQAATLIAREPKWFENKIQPTFREFLDNFHIKQRIGNNCIIKDCGRLINVSIGDNIIIEGASSLVNGIIINNSPNQKPMLFIGNDVDARDFIVEDGKLDSGALVRNCYIGQGVEIEKRATAHDSLFFSNSNFENGEACALLAGPYTVSMHKGTLLIGCQTSFMNAGSSTNESNHMYKLGPVHWGILERGVKTSSGAYVMFGAKIGAFSMVMGAHKTHPDSSSFPFSYLFGDEKGATVVVPGAMLRSCGLLRDEKKWPTRDRRLKRRVPLIDNITFNVLNPATVDKMLEALGTITELLSHPADDDLFVRHKGMKFTRAALERAKALYTAAIYKYLSMTLPGNKFPEKSAETPQQWIDLSGQIITRDTLSALLEKTSLTEVQQLLDDAFNNYTKDELQWIASRFGDQWRLSPAEIAVHAKMFDDMVEEDRKEYLENLDRETKMLSL